MSGENRIERVADELRRLESDGGTLDDILNGEVGQRWIEGACGEDLKLAKEAFCRVRPAARFFDVPSGEF